MTKLIRNFAGSESDEEEGKDQQSHEGGHDVAAVEVLSGHGVAYAASEGQGYQVGQVGDRRDDGSIEGQGDC